MVPPRVTVSAAGGEPSPELLEPELPQAVSTPALARTANHRTKTDDDVTLTDIPLLKFSEHNNKRTAPWAAPLSVANDKLNCNCETMRTLGTTLVASAYATKSCASAPRRASRWKGARASTAQQVDQRKTNSLKLRAGRSGGLKIGPKCEFFRSDPGSLPDLGSPRCRPPLTQTLRGPYPPLYRRTRPRTRQHVNTIFFIYLVLQCSPGTKRVAQTPLGAVRPPDLAGPMDRAREDP